MVCSLCQVPADGGRLPLGFRRTIHRVLPCPNVIGHSRIAFGERTRWRRDAMAERRGGGEARRRRDAAAVRRGGGAWRRRGAAGVRRGGGACRRETRRR